MADASVPERTKRCPRCNAWKAVSEFWNNRHRKDGLNMYCKPCAAEVKRERLAGRRKRCTRCAETKDLSEFATARGNKDGVRGMCLDCYRVYNAQMEAERRERAERAMCACGCGQRVKYPGARTLYRHYVKGDKPPTPKKMDTDGTDRPKKYERASKRTHKRCTQCDTVKPKEEFDQVKAPTLYGGETVRCFSYCKACARESVRERRGHLTDEEIARRREVYRQWSARNFARQKNLKLIRTFGITLEHIESMKTEQAAKCAVCQEERPLVIDHCHKENRVRALLCSQCNSALGLLREDEQIVLRLLNYIRTKVQIGDTR